LGAEEIHREKKVNKLGERMRDGQKKERKRERERENERQTEKERKDVKKERERSKGRSRQRKGDLRMSHGFKSRCVCVRHHRIRSK
jgi:hypothetical protein